MRVWFPTVRTNTGTDIYTMRLATGLEKMGIKTAITWLPHHAEIFPFLWQKTRPPFRPTIIHTNSWNGFAFAQKNVPLVVTAHLPVLEHDVASYKNFLQRCYHQTLIRHYEALSFQKAAKVIAVSQYALQAYRRHYPLPHAEVIYNGVDLEMFFPLPHVAHRPFRLLFAGSWSNRKGVDLLYDIMASLGEDYELWIASPTPLKQASLPKHSQYAGHTRHKDMARLYQTCDLLIFPSRLEGFGLAVAEAMACGLPVVASAVSSLPELVEDHQSGLLCPVDDALAFIKAIKRLAEDAELLKKMGEAARSRIVEHFSERAMLTHYQKLYATLLAE